MQHRAPPLLTLLLFHLLAIAALLLSAAARPTKAAAQTCISCGSPSIPTVSIVPASGSWSGTPTSTTQPVTVTFCQSSGTPVPGNEVIKLDGNNQSFTDGALSGGCFTASGSVILGAGTHTLTATLANSAGTGSGSATYVYTITATGGVAVSPDGGAGRASSAGGAQLFMVRNTDTQAHGFTLSALCTGGSLASCAPGRSTLTLAAGDSAAVSVSHTGSGGTVYLKAWRSDAVTARDSGWVTVPAASAVSEGLPNEAGSQTTVERSMCVKLPAGPAIFECGDLRMVRALPATRVLNRVRQPMLVYSSQQASPRPIVAATVSNAGPTVDLTLQFTGGNTYTSRVTGTAAPQARVAVSFDATGWPTGIYDYTLQATRPNADGTSTPLGSWPGTLAIVDGHNSAFGSGWSLAGLERIVPVSGSRLLWHDGDGSTRLYLPVPGSTTRWSPASFERPDTIVAQAAGGGWKRVLPGGDTILFDFAGRDTASLNALGQRTAFRYDGVGKLVSIVLPGNGQTSSLSYDLSYSGGVLQSITAPTATAGQASTRITQFVPDANGRIAKIISPDVRDTTILGYGDGTGRVTSIRDARHFTTSYLYDGGSRLSQVSWIDPGTGATAAASFSAAESRGLAVTSGVTAISSVRTVLDGPRVEPDVVTFYVNRWGAPTTIVDPLGNQTQIVHGDPAWPALATQTTSPNGRRVTASYDAAGRLLAQTDWATVSSDGRYATTTYAWHPKWESVTRVTLPEGETTYRGYDGFGRLEWVQPGSDQSRRTTISYNAPAAASGPGLPAATTYPLVAGQGTAAVEQYEYDSRGNVSGVRSPLGYYASYIGDAAGQVLQVSTPVDSAQTLFQVNNSVYDVMGRVTHTESVGPAMNGAPEQRLTTDTQYDPDGQPRSITRTALTSGSATLAITTGYRYDAAGRRVAEIAPDATPAVSTDNPVDSTAYDVAGNVRELHTRRINPATGQRLVIRMQYDTLNRLRTRIVPEVRYAARTEGIAAQPGMVTDASRNPPYPLFPNDGAGGYRIVEDTTVFDYDPVTGAMVSARNPFARVSRHYRLDGLVDSETDSVRTWADLSSGGSFSRHIYTLQYQYDLNGRRTSLSHPAALLPVQGGSARDGTSYGYDPLTGALSQVTDVLGNTFRFGYDELGQPDSVFLPGGVTEVYDYDADGRLRRHRVQNAGAGLPHHFTDPWLRDTRFAYDGRGKMTLTGNSFLARDTLVAQYSGLGYLLSSRSISHGIGYLGDSGRSDDAQTFTYDALGNQASMSTSNTLDRYLGMVRESSTSSMGYETGTGRLLTTQQSFLSETNQYDAAGNLVFASGNGIKSATLNDRALFYAADGTLRAADFRKRYNVTAEAPQRFTSVFEEYRYDPLGRRVAVWTRRWCELPGSPTSTESLAECRLGTMRRTVWDGSAELYEIQMPGAAADTLAENDTNPVPFIAWNSTRDGNFYDQNPYFGRVAYTYGLAVDQPLSITRIGLSDAGWDGSTNQQAGVTRWPAFAIMPLWTHRGSPDLATFSDGSAKHCATFGTSERCIPVLFPLSWFAYARSAWRPVAWWGTLAEDKQDRSGLSYRRNRYYDPDNGRFTQEDPIGLAGGLNLYGFAGGDPANYGDPYGLCPIWLRLFRGVCSVYDKMRPTEHQWLRTYGIRNGMIVYDAKKAAERDQQTAGRLNPRYAGSGHNTPADAIRHADWSCRLTFGLGAALAQTATDAHEGPPLDPRERARPEEERMDQWNNRVGRDLAEGVLSADACFGRAMWADSEGLLITSAEHPEW